MGWRTNRYGPCRTSPRSAGTTPKLRPRVESETAHPATPAPWMSVGSSSASCSCPASFKNDTLNVPATFVGLRRTTKRIIATVLIRMRPAVEGDGGNAEFAAWLKTRNIQTRAGRTFPGLNSVRVSHRGGRRSAVDAVVIWKFQSFRAFILRTVDGGGLLQVC